ncbi:MAG: VWA domain-containing protein [Kiritimatiellae bacterium]|nr:VWA domain-containing protein [Kiritimatiellia bacterium]
MLLLFLPLAFAAWRLLRRARRSGIKFSALSRLPAKGSNLRAKIASLTPYILLAALSLMVLAAARPRTSLAKERKSVDAIAIMMSVDVSGSMDALDLTPKGERFSRKTTRLAVVKKLFADFVAKRPDDLIGLVTFGGYAATRSPLMADHQALLNVLKGVEIPSIALDASGNAISREEQMTAIGDGLATALARLKDAKPKSKIAILLSDGVSNTGAVEPDEAAKAAAKLGIKVYAIGVGTRARRTPIFGRDFFGRETIQYADMTFDENQLKSIAKTTEGRYFSVNDRDSLAKALDEIDTLETTALDANVYNRWREHFAPFLLAGAILAFFAVSLSMSASRRVASLALIFSSLFALSANAAMPQVDEIVLQAKPKSGHLQDVWYDGSNTLYWAHTREIYKTDLAGNVLAKVDVKGHHAGLETRGGKLYVAVCPMQSETGGKTTPECRLTVGEYDENTLKLIKMHVLDINDRAGSLTILDDGSFLVGCLRPGDIALSQVRFHHLTSDFTLIKSYVLDNLPVRLGIEILKRYNGSVYLNMYGVNKEGAKLGYDSIRLSADFKEEARGRMGGATGLVFDGDNIWTGWTNLDKSTKEYTSKIVRRKFPKWAKK